MSSTTSGASAAAAQQAESNYNRTTNSKQIINDLNYDSSSSSTSSSSPHQYDDEQQRHYSQSQYQQSKQPFQTNYNQTGENNISNMMMLMNYNQNSSFNNSITNSSGLGDSMSLPCMSADNSSIYNNQNGQYMSGSMPATPSSPNKNDDSCSSSESTSPPPLHHSKINPNAPIFKQMQQSKNQEMLSKLNSLNLNNTAQVQQFHKMLSTNEQQKNNYLTNNSNPDYDPFNDYVGMEKMIMQMTNSNVDPTTAYLIKNKMASLNLSNMDPQQQQLITQAIASVVASEQQQQQQQVGKPMNTSSRSMSENIEMLNSKYLLNQKNNVSNNSNNQNEQIIQSNMNSLLATVANSDSYNMTGYNSPNMPINMKRLSFPQAANNQSLSPAASPHHQSTSSPFNNNRLSSNHNLFGSVNLNDQSNRNGNQSAHQDKISQSNSAFNISLNGNNANNNTIESNTNNAFHNANNSTSSANNSSCYDDDDVFTNTNSSSTVNQSGFNPQQLNAANIDPATLSQLYRNFLNNPGNGSNISDLLSNYNANLAALSLNPDIQNFNKNSSSNSNAQLSQQLVAAAVYKQRQSMLNNRLSNVLASNTNSTSGSSNIAALTSATSNIAALLNTNSGQQQQSQQFLGNNDSKRRINSQSSFNTQTANNSGQSFNNALSSGLFSGSHSMGPNATHLLQNSSLASSARLNSSTSSSAAASVLGNNSTLSHALNSLSHHQANLSLQNQTNSHLLNGGSLNSSINGVNQSLLNFNSSPSSNQGILSALSLSSTAGSSLAGTLLSSSGKPLRSERLPSTLVEEIIKQAKVRRRNGGKKEVCVFCRNNGEKEQIYTSHTLKDASNHVACPILRLYQCPICHASGDQAHTIKYCPYAEKDSNCIKLFKENGRMTAAAALLMNSMSNSPPPLSPPATPPPQSAAQLNYLQQQQQQYHSSFNHPNDISSPNASQTAYTLAQLASLNNLSQNSFSLSNTPNQNNNNKSAFLNSASLNNTAIANAAANSMLNSNGNSSLLSSNFSNSANLKQINN